MVELGLYRHFKGGEYEVIGTARNSEDEYDEYVVYKNLYDHPKYGRGQIWIRPKGMFEEMIERDGKKIKRFEFIRQI